MTNRLKDMKYFSNDVLSLSLLLLLFSDKLILIWCLSAVNFSSFQECKDSKEIAHQITAIFRHDVNQPLSCEKIQ